MFRTFIYLDTEKLSSYSKVIMNSSETVPRKKTTTTKQSAGFNRTLAASASKEESIESDYEKDCFSDYDKFEFELTKLEDEKYFDFVLNDSYDYKTLPSMSILRRCGTFIVPEEFDTVSMMANYKKLILDRTNFKKEIDKEAAYAFIEDEVKHIPIIIEEDDIVLASKLQTKYLLEDINAMEEFQDQEVYMLCKIVGLQRQESVEIYNPIKEMVSLPRSLRRKMPKQAGENALSPIVVEGPVLKVEVIAIYQ